MAMRRTPLMSMLAMLARPRSQLRRTLSHASLRLGTRCSDGTDNTSPASKDRLDRIIVIQPIVVRPALSLRPSPLLKATRHRSQTPGMCPQISAICSILISGGAIPLAQLAPTNRDVRALVSAKAGAGHGYAEAVADADVKVGRAGAYVPFEFRVTSPQINVIGTTDEHGAAVGEAHAADLVIAEGGCLAARPAVPPVPKVVASGDEGDADAVAVAAGAGRDGAAPSGGVGSRRGSRVDSAGC